MADLKPGRPSSPGLRLNPAGRFCPIPSGRYSRRPDLSINGHGACPNSRLCRRCCAFSMESLWRTQFWRTWFTADLPSGSGESQRMTGAGKGRPAGMAILDTETDERCRSALIAVAKPCHQKGRVDEIVEAESGVGDHAGALARVRRHALRRLLFGRCRRPGRSPPSSGRCCVSRHFEQPGERRRAAVAGRLLFNLAMIPMFIGAFAVYGLYRGSPGGITNSVFSDLRNILHALMISGFLWPSWPTSPEEDFASWSRSRWARSPPCAWWPWSLFPWPGWSPLACRPGLGRLGAGHRGRHRKAGPDRGQPPAGPFQCELRRVRGRQPVGAAVTSSASSRTFPRCAANTAWPGWWSASRAPTPSAPPRC